MKGSVTVLLVVEIAAETGMFQFLCASMFTHPFHSS